MWPDGLLWGCDFTSAPSRRKPIVLAVGEWQTARSGAVRLQLQGFYTFDTLAGFGEHLLSTPAWLGAFDLPFGLPRELVEHVGWPTDWHACMQHYTRLSREQIRSTFAAFCDARPVGGKFAHRTTDGPAGSSPSMKWVNPPVAYMMHAGVPLLMEAGAYLPGIMSATLEPTPRIALEAYPGLLARMALGHRSYKSDDKAKQTPERWVARKDLLHALDTGQLPALNGLRCVAKAGLQEAMLQDATGDHVDAWLCLVQASWALMQHQQGHPCFGLPPCDPLEGWILMA